MRLQKYRDCIISVCGKHSVPLKENVIYRYQVRSSLNNSFHLVIDSIKVKLKPDNVKGLLQNLS